AAEKKKERRAKQAKYFKLHLKNIIARLYSNALITSALSWVEIHLPCLLFLSALSLHQK
ncbi:MAG: hypothetical protein RLZZ351_942, partial [Pseudomonadota bacterium]